MALPKRHELRETRPLRKEVLSKDEAAALALQGLTFLAGDMGRLGRFLSLTGFSPADLKASIGTPRLQTAVLEYLLSDESLLLVFSAETGVKPESVAPARALLAKALSEDEDASAGNGRHEP